MVLYLCRYLIQLHYLELATGYPISRLDKINMIFDSYLVLVL